MYFAHFTCVKEREKKKEKKKGALQKARDKRSHRRDYGGIKKGYRGGLKICTQTRLRSHSTHCTVILYI